MSEYRTEIKELAELMRQTCEALVRMLQNVAPQAPAAPPADPEGPARQVASPASRDPQIASGAVEPASEGSSGLWTPPPAPTPAAPPPPTRERIWLTNRFGIDLDHDDYVTEARAALTAWGIPYEEA